MDIFDSLDASKVFISCNDDLIVSGLLEYKKQVISAVRSERPAIACIDGNIKSETMAKIVTACKDMGIPGIIVFQL